MSYKDIEPVIVSSHDAISRKYRLDPSQYNADVEKIIRHCAYHNIAIQPLDSLGWITEVYLPNRFSRSYTGSSTRGTIMIGTSSMLDMKLPRDMRVHLSEIKSSRDLFIHDNDILISRSGTVGTSTLCGKSYEECIASDDCIRLRCDKDHVGYVAAYLKTAIGLSLLAKDSHGKVIKHLSTEDVRYDKILVPNDGVIKRVNQMMLEAKDAFDEARVLFGTVEKLLEDNLGRLVPPSFENHNIKAFGSLKLTRLDPHMYDPYTDYITHEIKKRMNYKELHELADVVSVTRFKRHYLEPGNENAIGLYSSSDIVRARLLPSKYISRTLNQRNIEMCRVSYGDILLPCSGAYGGILGKGMMVGKRLDNKPVSQHVMRIIPRKDTEVNPHYMTAFLCSFTFGYPLITATRFGKDIPELDPNAIRNIPIPIIDDQKQKDIADTYMKAVELQELGNSLEESAETVIYTEYGAANR